jgi:hypothetical protein
MFLILLVLLFTKLRRSFSLEQFLSAYLIKFCKLAVVFAAYVVDMKLCVAFVVLYSVLLLVGPQEPPYDGASNVKEIGMEYFKTHIDNERADPALTWIVHMYSIAAEESTWFQSEFARTSLHYGYDRSSVHFVTLSLDAFPKLVDKYQILTPEQNRFSYELPTVLMFCGGKLLARLPEVGRKTMMDEVNMVRGMDLETRARLEPSVFKQIEAKAKGGAGATEPKSTAESKQQKKTK